MSIADETQKLISSLPREFLIDLAPWLRLDFTSQGHTAA
jgi:hypothetical protein